MKDSEFVGAWKEFREWEHKEHQRIHSDLSEIKKEIKELSTWKTKVTSGAAVIATLGGTVGAYIFEVLKGGK